MIFRRVIKLGRSYAVTVPREYADAIGMIKGSIVRVTVRDDKTLCVAVEERLYDPQKTILRPAPGA